MVRTVLLTILLSELAYNEMQASVRTCRRSAADSITPKCRLKSSHDPNCRLKSNHVKAIYFNHPSQGNSTNYYLILGPRDKAAPPTYQQIKQLPPKRVKYLATPSSIFIFISSSSTGGLSALSQSEARFTELGEYSQNMLSEALTPSLPQPAKPPG